ncbi:TIGR03619 family F420-dependent LLM class oxidoreductase [Myxococcota bacterium]|nr:TIGR03619 family F420-dependent LLM class oxidoreductase [Myxococcota bacterium]
MKFWQAIAFTEPDQLVDFARLAEEFRFTGVTMGDHFVTPTRIDSSYPYTPDNVPWVQPNDPSPDPLMLTGALAQVTERLRFMVTAYVLPMREPLVAAKAISTAAVLSNHRLDLGVGVGWMKEEFQAAGQDFHTRGQRCDEAMAAIDRLMTGEKVSHRGAFYDIPECQLCPVPDQPVPILIAGHSDAAFRRAARYEGWLGAHYAVDELPPIAERFQKVWSECGRADAPRIVSPITDLGSLDDCKRLEDAGLTDLIHMPLTFQGIPASSLDDKRRAMESFVEQFVVPLGP